MLTHDTTITGAGVQILADSPYGSGDMLAAIAAMAHGGYQVLAAAASRDRRLHP